MIVNENINLNLRNIDVQRYTNRENNDLFYSHCTQKSIKSGHLSLLMLPVELLYRILDYVDTQTILYGLRHVCMKFYSIINTYNRYKLHFTSMSQIDVKMLSRLIHPTDVISLCFSNNGQKSHLINEFHSHFDISQFTRLRSLTLLKISNSQLSYFLQHITSFSLISFSIELCERQSENMWTFLTPILTQPSLRNLHLHADQSILDRIPWPKEYKLQHMKIHTCTYTQYYNLLLDIPYLRTFSTKCFIINNTEESRLLNSSTLAYHHQMECLTIEECSFLMNDLELIVSLTPLLVYLKLIANISDAQMFSVVCDASRWEALIHKNLPLLRKFEFLFSLKLIPNEETESLDSFVAPFQTSYWFNEKHCSVTSVYVIQLAEIWLYTIPVCVLYRLPIYVNEVSVVNSNYRLVTYCSYENLDVPEKEKVRLYLCFVRNSEKDCTTKYTIVLIRKNTNGNFII